MKKLIALLLLVALSAAPPVYAADVKITETIGAAIVITTSDTNAVESPEKMSIFNINHHATAATAVTYTLPTAAAGKARCYGQYTGNTGTIRVNTSAAGQYIDKDGVASASGGYVISGGALGDRSCFIGISATEWIMYPTKGTWTLN